MPRMIKGRGAAPIKMMENATEAFSSSSGRADFEPNEIVEILDDSDADNDDQTDTTTATTTVAQQDKPAKKRKDLGGDSGSAALFDVFYGNGNTNHRTAATASSSSSSSSGSALIHRGRRPPTTETNGSTTIGVPPPAKRARTFSLSDNSATVQHRGYDLQQQSLRASAVTRRRESTPTRTTDGTSTSRTSSTIEMPAQKKRRTTATDSSLAAQATNNTDPDEPPFPTDAAAAQAERDLLWSVEKDILAAMKNTKALTDEQLLLRSIQRSIYQGNPPWMTKPPSSSSAQSTRVFRQRHYSWCALCSRWNATHSTRGHDSRDEESYKSHIRLVPREMDVVFGNTKQNRAHLGNSHFEEFVKRVLHEELHRGTQTLEKKKKWLQARQERHALSQQVVDRWRKEFNGRFMVLKKGTKGAREYWTFDDGEQRARCKALTRLSNLLLDTKKAKQAPRLQKNKPTDNSDAKSPREISTSHRDNGADDGALTGNGEQDGQESNYNDGEDPVNCPKDSARDTNDNDEKSDQMSLPTGPVQETPLAPSENDESDDLFDDATSLESAADKKDRETADQSTAEVGEEDHQEQPETKKPTSFGTNAPVSSQDTDDDSSLDGSVRLPHMLRYRPEKPSPSTARASEATPTSRPPGQVSVQAAHVSSTPSREPDAGQDVAAETFDIAPPPSPPEGDPPSVGTVPVGEDVAAETLNAAPPRSPPEEDAPSVGTVPANDTEDFQSVSSAPPDESEDFQSVASAPSDDGKEAQSPRCERIVDTSDVLPAPREVMINDASAGDATVDKEESESRSDTPAVRTEVPPSSGAANHTEAPPSASSVMVADAEATPSCINAPPIASEGLLPCSDARGVERQESPPTAPIMAVDATELESSRDAPPDGDEADVPSSVTEDPVTDMENPNFVGDERECATEQNPSGEREDPSPVGEFPVVDREEPPSSETVTPVGTAEAVPSRDGPPLDLEDSPSSRDAPLTITEEALSAPEESGFRRKEAPSSSNPPHVDRDEHTSDEVVDNEGHPGTHSTASSDSQNLSDTTAVGSKAAPSSASAMEREESLLLPAAIATGGDKSASGGDATTDDDAGPSSSSSTLEADAEEFPHLNAVQALHTEQHPSPASRMPRDRDELLSTGDVPLVAREEPQSSESVTNARTPSLETGSVNTSQHVPMQDIEQPGYTLHGRCTEASGQDADCQHLARERERGNEVATPIRKESKRGLFNTCSKQFPKYLGRGKSASDRHPLFPKDYIDSLGTMLSFGAIHSTGSSEALQSSPKRLDIQLNDVENDPQTVVVAFHGEKSLVAAAKERVQDFVMMQIHRYNLRTLLSDANAVELDFALDTSEGTTMSVEDFLGVAVADSKFEGRTWINNDSEWESDRRSNFLTGLWIKSLHPCGRLKRILGTAGDKGIAIVNAGDVTIESPNDLRNAWRKFSAPKVISQRSEVTKDNCSPTKTCREDGTAQFAWPITVCIFLSLGVRSVDGKAVAANSNCPRRRSDGSTCFRELARKWNREQLSPQNQDPMNDDVEVIELDAQNGEDLHPGETDASIGRHEDGSIDEGQSPNTEADRSPWMASMRDSPVEYRSEQNETMMHEEDSAYRNLRRVHDDDPEDSFPTELDEDVGSEHAKGTRDFGNSEDELQTDMNDPGSPTTCCVPSSENEEDSVVPKYRNRKKGKSTVGEKVEDLSGPLLDAGGVVDLTFSSDENDGDEETTTQETATEETQETEQEQEQEKSTKKMAPAAKGPERNVRTPAGLSSGRKDNQNHILWKAFQTKYRKVREIEYSNTQIRGPKVVGQMWQMHKDLFGVNCHDNCQCVPHMDKLTSTVIASHIQELRKKGSRCEDDLNRIDSPVGFVNRFAIKFYRVIHRRFPNRTNAQILEDLTFLWTYHKSERRFGITCRPNCTCIDSWERLFLPLLNERMRSASAAAKMSLQTSSRRSGLSKTMSPLASKAVAVRADNMRAKTGILRPDNRALPHSGVANAGGQLQRSSSVGVLGTSQDGTSNTLAKPPRVRKVVSTSIVPGASLSNPRPRPATDGPDEFYIDFDLHQSGLGFEFARGGNSCLVTVVTPSLQREHPSLVPRKTAVVGTARVTNRSNQPPQKTPLDSNVELQRRLDEAKNFLKTHTRFRVWFQKLAAEGRTIQHRASASSIQQRGAARLSTISGNPGNAASALSDATHGLNSTEHNNDQDDSSDWDAPTEMEMRRSSSRSRKTSSLPPSWPTALDPDDMDLVDAVLHRGHNEVLIHLLKGANPGVRDLKGNEIMSHVKEEIQVAKNSRHATDDGASRLRDSFLKEKVLKIFFRPDYLLTLGRALPFWRAIDFTPRLIKDLSLSQKTTSKDTIHCIVHFGDPQKHSVGSPKSPLGCNVDWSRHDFLPFTFHVNEMVQQSRSRSVQVDLLKTDETTATKTLLGRASFSVEEIMRALQSTESQIVEAAFVVGTHIRRGCIAAEVRNSKEESKEQTVKEKSLQYKQKLEESEEWIRRFNADTDLPTRGTLTPSSKFPRTKNLSLFHLSIYSANTQLVKDLLKKGANPNLQSDLGRPLDLAEDFARKLRSELLFELEEETQNICMELRKVTAPASDSDTRRLNDKPAAEPAGRAILPSKENERPFEGRRKSVRWASSDQPGGGNERDKNIAQRSASCQTQRVDGTGSWSSGGSHSSGSHTWNQRSQEKTSGWGRAVTGQDQQSWGSKRDRSSWGSSSQQSNKKSRWRKSLPTQDYTSSSQPEQEKTQSSDGGVSRGAKPVNNSRQNWSSQKNAQQGAWGSASLGLPASVSWTSQGSQPRASWGASSLEGKKGSAWSQSERRIGCSARASSAIPFEDPSTTDSLGTSEKDESEQRRSSWGVSSAISSGENSTVSAHRSVEPNLTESLSVLENQTSEERATQTRERINSFASASSPGSGTNNQQGWDSGAGSRCKSSSSSRNQPWSSKQRSSWSSGSASMSSSGWGSARGDKNRRQGWSAPRTSSWGSSKSQEAGTASTEARETGSAVPSDNPLPNPNDRLQSSSGERESASSSSSNPTPAPRTLTETSPLRSSPSSAHGWV